MMKFNTKFLRFLIVGVINTIVGLSISFISLNIFQVNYWVSTFSGNGVGAVVSYFLNRKFTFKSNTAVRKTFWKFIIVILLCYFISYWTSSFIVKSFIQIGQFSLSNQILDNISTLFGAGLYTISNYLGQKIIVFSNSYTRNSEKSIDI